MKLKLIGGAAVKKGLALLLPELLEIKADFGVKLKAAYDAGDREALLALAAQCNELIKRTRALSDAHKAAFHTYQKPFGYEMHDHRYGGMLLRLETAKERILAYLDGSIARLEELEEQRLPFAPGLEGRFGNAFTWTRYRHVTSPSTSLPI